MLCISVFVPKAGAFPYSNIEPQLLEPNSKPVDISYCVDPDWLPYEAIVEGKHVGISSDYLQLISQSTGYTFTLVPTQSWSESLAYLKQGLCMMTPFLNITPDRELFLQFSDIYFEAPNVLVSLKSEPFLQGFGNIGDRVLAIPSGYRLVEYVQRHYPKLNLKLASSEKAGLESVARGEADVFVGSMFSVNAYIQQTDLTELKIAGWGGPADELRFGFTNEAAYLLPLINQALADITETQRINIYNKWHNVSIIEDIDYEMAARVLLLLGGCIFLLLYRNYCINQYSIELEQHNKQLDALRLSLEQKNHQLDFLAKHDPLTQLYNRHYFHSHFVDNASENLDDSPTSLIIMDADHFKLINDNFGHSVGDHVLSVLAQLLKTTVHNSDVVARWGGEEFIIVCPNVELDEAYALCQRLAAKLQQTDFGAGINITCSYGIAKLTSGEPILACLERADKALYRAKVAGRNQICTDTHVVEF
ncbi:diguanylate cyclase domain-containing protein [Shewanella sp. SR44-3]|uniref:diguanylate cyclase domain-containing protein n=2 Tax=Shewanella sp. TaxID=50422 RepID=UPI0015FD19A4|nr:diguanylate cyclase [Shewanella sp. SR44-3]